jgi:hypothetical protein
MTEKPNNIEELNPPDEFYKIINDFIIDILITFPEYSGIVSRWWNNLNDEETQKKETLLVFRHCVKVFPERFFDILYKNIELFSEDSEHNTEFLPGIVFKQLWNLNISDNTKETIWKYLQLILFSVIGTVHNSSELGDTAKLFEVINEEELKKKLEETLEGMQNIFNTDNTDNTNNTSENFTDASLNGINMENMPNAEQLHEHINSMMEGKLGKLALELAQETAEDLNLNINETGDAKDVFQKLFKNPGKMMNMVKNIGNKIDAKLKSGELKESELMEEGMELLNKMKNMPGMGDMQKMFSQMGIPGLGKGAKVNMGAMEAQLNKNMKMAKMKERLKAKQELKQKQQEEQNQQQDIKQEQQITVSEEELIKIFSTGEKVEKTPRGTKPPIDINQEGKKKGKKGKK